MAMGKIAVDWGNRIFSFKGRIGQASFGKGLLALIAANLVLGWIPYAGVLVWVTLYCLACLNGKRLHDMGRSGWWQAVPLAVSLGCLGLAIYLAFTEKGNGAREVPTGDEIISLGVAILATLIGLVVGVSFLAWLGFSKSQVGENRFDPATPVEGTPG